MITQAQIDQLKWYHDFDFPNGLHARSFDHANAAFHQLRWSFISEQLQAVELVGKTVIDVGCWDGYFSFLAEKRGAKSVLAVDDFSQNWGGADCFGLAKELFQSSVSLMPDVSVYELSRRINQKFDVVFFFGVYYHLHSPFCAFAEIRSLCHDQSVVIIEGECMQDDEESYARMRIDNPYDSQFIPTTRLLQDILHACYFEINSTALLSEGKNVGRLKELDPQDLLNVAKLALKAKQSTSARTRRSEPTDRILVIAKPWVGDNPFHLYKPQFGLWRFDTRDKFRDHE